MITALLLFLQLRVTRSSALMVLACGYVYTALMAAIHLLTFPGVFTPAGLLGGGAQTTAYLFRFLALRIVRVRARGPAVRDDAIKKMHLVGSLLGADTSGDGAADDDDAGSNAALPKTPG